MYYRHFGLDGPPFRFTSSQTAVYLGAAHRECLAALQWGLLYDQCGFMLLLGETGTGKTTLVNTVLARRLPNLHLACVPNPRLSFQEVLRVVLPQLGVVTDERGKLELIQALERAVANRPEGSRTAIIIDEAQDLTDETFEDLRLLANTVGARDRELQIVLMGHPELLDRLSAHHLRQLRERISTKVSLPALSTTESVAYIDYRLQAQNGSARIFEPNALKYLIKAAAGIPRRLNVLCHNALLLAYSKNKSTVTLEVAREVVGDYQGIFPLSNVEPRPALRTVEPATREPGIGAEPVIRPRRPMALAAAACAAFAVLGFGSVFVARTSNLSGEFDRMAHGIEASPVTPDASSQSTEDVKTVAATLGYTASIADASPAAPMPALKTEPAPAPRHTTIQIRPGDTFHDLAVKYLGSKDRTRELINANPQIKDPDNLYVGQTIYLPAHQPTKLAGEVQ
ncbi:AAA family ATPase [Candidatus Binatus sp.]|uniref:AAA family ATPase n=1 Tax=Candidatus Binatus sp. TaxID=2811406 RepID=UPI003C453D9C